MTGIEAALSGRVASESIELRTSSSQKALGGLQCLRRPRRHVEWIRVSVIQFSCREYRHGGQERRQRHCEGRPEVWRSKKDGVEKASLQLTAWKVEKIGASVIGRSRPKKPRRRRMRPPLTGGRASARDWQRSLDAEIPF
jgi:hypothetical protein